jgi:hypothetical protein
MKIGRSPIESMLPPRFERMYQPEKLAQFDRFFARSWATPVRRSHSAQHNGDMAEDFSEFKRNVYGRSLDIPDRDETKDDEEDQDNIETMDHFISKHGFQPKKRSTLRRFVQQHDIYDDEVKPSRSILSNDDVTEKLPSYRYIGDTNRWNDNPREEYLRCVKPSEYLESSLYNPVAFEEFKESLHPMSLNANDVHGIQELAESAHVGREIQSGPYKGFDRNFSAIEVSTVVFEQLNAYENIRKRGDLQEGIPIMDAELVRRGFHMVGVKDSITNEFERQKIAEKQYHETCLESSSKYRRSDLTTTNSLKLYTSFFSPDEALVTPDLSVLLGETPGDNGKKIKPGRVELKDRTSDFVSKAAKKGVQITSHKELEKARSQPLFQFQRTQTVPAGFEMINEDMLSRKDNKFMVFNGPGVDSWTGTQPVTKLSGIEQMLAGTLI